jgi:dihydrofolate reductase
MRKLIATINMTLDGFCDHDVIAPDAELHQHFADVVKNADTLLYGRKTSQLMEYWKSVVENPTGEPATDDFAKAIDAVRKIVYSRTLEGTDWRNTELRREIDKTDIENLKRRDGNDIYAGSPSMLVQLSNLGLVDEYQIMLHPSVVGSGLPLFKDIADRIDLKLTNSKPFRSGAILLTYEPVR